MSAQDALPARESGPVPDAAIVDAMLRHLSGFEIARPCAATVDSADFADLTNVLPSATMLA